MALGSCRDCGHNCSSKALACPACGRLMRGRVWWATTIGWGVIMSVVLSFLLTLVLFLAFRIWIPVL